MAKHVTCRCGFKIPIEAHFNEISGQCPHCGREFTARRKARRTPPPSPPLERAAYAATIVPTEPASPAPVRAAAEPLRLKSLATWLPKKSHVQFGVVGLIGFLAFPYLYSPRIGDQGTRSEGAAEVAAASLASSREIELQRQRDEELRRQAAAQAERERLERERAEAIALDEAIRQVTSKAKGILLVAHPTSSLQNVEYKFKRTKANGEQELVFDLVYRTAFLKAICYLELIVTVDSDGKYQGAVWGRDTGAIPPGAAAGAAAAVLAEALDDR
ncbi:MAG: hypothetical protein U1D30_06805 [Planctomycetota bacterium]